MAATKKSVSQNGARGDKGGALVAWEDERDVMVGTLVSNYRIVRKVSEESLSADTPVALAVYALQHEPSKRQAVLKVLSPALSEPGGPAALLHPAAARFFDAARALYLVRDPGFLEILDCDTLSDGTPYVIHEDPGRDGELLQSRLERFGRFPELLALLLGQQVAAALHAAHRKGVAPVGLSPARVLILPDASAPGEERAKVLLPKGDDRDEAGEGPQIGTGTMPDPSAAPVSDTGRYLAPEQRRRPVPAAPQLIQSQPCEQIEPTDVSGPALGLVAVDGAADVYLLGMLLYHMLTGRVYAHSEVARLGRSAVGQEDGPMLRPDVLRQDVARLLSRMLAEEPDGRPALGEVVPELVRLGQRPSQELWHLHDTFGKYRVLRKLGEGGMGTVYLAVNEETGHQVAVKVLHQELAQMPQILKRFYNEARTANHVKHPGIVSVYELGQIADRPPFIVMEYLDGESLGARMGRLGGALPLSDALSIGHQVATIMSAAHERGVIHRDLKPDNVMIVRDPFVPGGERVKVLDFGIAKLMPYLERVSVQRTSTRTGGLLGTPVYMAPEQCRGQGQVTERADVYALGVMLFELLAGRAPFHAAGVSELIAMHLYCEPPPLGQAVPGVGSDLEALVGSMLGKIAADRPPMVQVAAELKWLGQQRGGMETLIKAPVLAGKATLRSPPHMTQVRGGKRREEPFQPGLRHWVGFGVVLSCFIGVLLLLTAVNAPQQQGDGPGPVVQREAPPDQAAAGPRVVTVREPGGTTESLYGLWTGGQEGFAVGGNGVILRRRGDSWGPDGQSQMVTADLYGVWGNGPDDVWAVGQEGTALYFDGRRWIRVGTGVRQHLNAVWGSGPADVWAVGMDTVLHWDGHGWRRAAGGKYLLYSVWGRARGDGLDSAQRSGAPSIDGAALPAEIWAVGAEGAIVHFDGRRWESARAAGGADLHGVWGTGPADVWAVGQAGTVLHLGGDGAWREVDGDGPGELTLDCIGGGLSGVYAAGHDRSGAALVLLKERRWQRVALETGLPDKLERKLELYALSGRAGLLLVGKSGTVLRQR